MELLKALRKLILLQDKGEELEQRDITPPLSRKTLSSSPLILPLEQLSLPRSLLHSTSMGREL